LFQRKAYSRVLLMENNEKLVAGGVFAVLFLWLTWTIYWLDKLYVSLPGIYLVPNPFSYPLYLSSTLSLTFLFVGVIARNIGIVLAIVCAAMYFSKAHMSRIRSVLAAAIVMEAVYLISIIPTAWVGPNVGDSVLVYEATIPSVFEAIFVPIPLFILAYRLWREGKPGTVARWGCISGVMYIFAIWIRFLMQWVATIIQTPVYTNPPGVNPSNFFGFPSHGWSYLLNFPLNMLGFILTAVGLPLVAVYLLYYSMPAIRNLGAQVPTRKVGLALILVGAWFMIEFFFLYALPGYVGAKSIWATFFTGHDVDLWMLGLPIVGIPLLFRSDSKPMPKQEV
jgi:hypothetical protein